MYIVVRTWANAGALADAIQEKEQEVTDLLSGVPGFAAYYASRSGDTLTTVTVCETQAGTQESTRLAADWVRRNLPGASIGAPQISEGEVFLQV